MIHKKTCFIILITLLQCISVAQPNTKIGLKQAVDSAILNFPGLKSKQFEMAGANAYLSDAKHQRLPSLKLSDQIDYGTDNGLGGSYFPLGIVPSTSGGIRADNNTNSFSGNIGVAYLEEELYNFGLNAARIASAKSLLKQYKSDYDKTSFLLQYTIAQLYFEMLRYQLLLSIQKKNIARNMVLNSFVKAYTSSGIKPGVDSSLANAEVSKAKIEYLKTFDSYSTLKYRFLFLTGMRVNNIEIDTAVYTASDAFIDQMSTKVSVDSVRASNPVLQYYNSQWEYSLSLEKTIRRSFMPKLNLMGAAWFRGSSINSKDVYGDAASGLDYSRYNYMAGLSLSYNITDVVHQHDKSAIQHFQSEAVHETLIQQQSLLANQLQEADIAIQSAIARQLEIPVQLKAAQEVYSQKLAQYNAGLATITELTDASYLLFKSETDKVESLSDLLHTLLQKAVTNNTLNAFITSF